ncbi:hypothetical protein DUNSADRAFT_18488 [Dunaliella salina]|uniref:PBP domain-containing protein n=1 Tax=Dunaliella salina TaxID=3046 RepID=A0ABQ7GYY9_DUNSA|nr:hypothetical protein DUNSADRAFT_18488 [Dunaliella salina]|eukprot:KAF5839826.1 hypothetical protein DUNSADRAFT_18488 [Dunaliella salina]
MIDKLLGLQSAIGYLESGQGIANGLSEVQLRNKAGTYLRHNDDKTTIVSDSVLDESFPEGDESALENWSSVSLINRGGETTWPLALVSYCYARQDLTFLGRNSGLTKFILKHLLSDEVSTLAKERYGFTPLTKSKRDGFQSQLENLLQVQNDTDWTLEIDTNDNIGQTDRVVSTHRESFTLRAIEEGMSQIERFLVADARQDARMSALEREIEEQKAASAQGIYQVHGSGTSNPAPLFWNVMQTLQTRAKPAALMTYRSVGSGAGQRDLDTSANVSKSDFSCGDYPLSTEKWQASQDNNRVLHIPLFVGTISIFAKIPGISEAVKLSPCPLVKIFSGAITSWNDPEIQDENPGLSLPDRPITVVHRAPGSSSTNAFTTYLREASLSADCSSKWPSDEVGSAVSQSQWASNKKEALNSQQMIDELTELQSAIGYLESGQGIANGLSEVQLRNKAGTYLRHNDDKTTIVSDDVLNESFPEGDESVLADWSSVSLINRGGETIWPLALVSYCYARQDLTFLGRNSGLTKFVLNYMLSDEVSQLAKERYGFTPLTKNKRDGFQIQLDKLLEVQDGTEWTLETETDDEIGQTDRVVSIHRESYVLRAIEDGMSQVGGFLTADGSQDARMRVLQKEVEDQKDKADKALDVAIAGLVIGLILGLLGASLGVVALKRADGSKGGRYSDHLGGSAAAENPTFSSY